MSARIQTRRKKTSYDKTLSLRQFVSPDQAGAIYMATSHDGFHLVFEEHAGYFFACVEAETLTEEMVEEYRMEIAQEIIKRRSRRVMIKRDVPHTRSTAELYHIPMMVDSLNALGIKYAFVDVVPEHLRTYQLALLDAKHRGREIAVFGDVDAAEKWLLETI